jgi:ribonucleoside-diphosphate reductase beta chain
MTITHDTFITTSSRGLRQDILPMRLYHKAKKLGIWDPQSIDFSQDILDWLHLKDTEKESLLQLTALFQAGEECVTLDLLPLVMIIAQEGRLEEEMFLAISRGFETKSVTLLFRNTASPARLAL